VTQPAFLGLPTFATGRALDEASLDEARVRATVIGGALAFGSPTAP
jgi:hypothetical protein